MEGKNSCSELYCLLSNNFDNRVCRLTFAPDQSDVVTKFFLSEDENSVEIVCFKTTYLSVFKEAHHYFKKYQLLSASPQNWETYYFSLGYLLTTPENKTNFNIHLDTFRGLLAKDDSKELLEKELRVIQRLLTSTNNRLNKSSSLWHLYRQLYTLSLQFSRSFDHDYLSTFLESGDRHFSNYYCWNAAKWFFDIFTISQREALVKRTMEFCFRNFKDSSSWDALTYMICQSRRNLNYNIKEFHRLQYMLRSSKILSTQKYVEFRIEEILRDIVHLIDSFTVSEWSPFLCCLTIVFTFCELDTNFLSTAWKSDVEAFERSNGPVQIIRNNPVPSQEYTQDLVLRSTAAHICYKKRFLTMFIYMYNK